MYGSIYFLIECLWKGKITDISMFILSGFLGVSVGLINNLFSWDTSFILQCFTGTLLATLSEAIIGIEFLNRGIHVWSYKTLPLSFCNGTINIFFSIAWFILCGIAIILDDYLRYWFFKEEKPRYKLF